MNRSKLIFIKVTLIFFVSGSLFFIFFQKQKNSSLEPFPAQKSDSGAFFSCTNFQTTYFDEQWGTLDLAAQEGSYSQTKVLRCLKLTGTLHTRDKGKIFMSAQEGIFDQNNDTICLKTNVLVQTTYGAITTDKLTAHTQNETLEACGNVQTIFKQESLRRR